MNGLIDAGGCASSAISDTSQSFNKESRCRRSSQLMSGETTNKKGMRVARYD